ncbi:LapA family protein [Thalassoglobus sp.]|uniref:LapA family protein n=1 Tax=Thalassoglobus sp. TaxID=2795869 RepID=UPI003AA942F3
MKKAKIIGSVIAALLVLIVVLQNTAVVETKVLFTTISMPRATLLFITLVVGFLLGLVVAGRWNSRKKK